MKPTFFATPSDFRQWLEANHHKEVELIVGFYKVGSGKPSINWKESVEEALCFGWIDGIRRALDECSFTVRFTPRKAKSGWSKINTQNAERLAAEGRMRPAGLKEIERAKEDGRWHQAYDSPKDMKLPDEFLAMVEANPRAKAFLATLKRANLYAIAYRLQTAKKPETRAKRMKDTLEMLERGEAYHPFLQKPKA